MGYSTLSYDSYIEHSDYWYGQLGVQLPAWAHDVYAAGGRPVSALDFYAVLFAGDDDPARQLEPHRTPDAYRQGEYGAIAVERVPYRSKTGKLEYRGRRTTVTRDCIELADLIDRSEHFCLMSPISYIGLTRTDAHARYLFALALEIDDIQPESGVTELFYSWERETSPLPRPTFVVCSGTGLHLYFVLAHPIPLFGNVLEALKAVKHWLVLHYWTPITTQTEKLGRKIQFEAVTQPFRIVGTRTRKGCAYAMAFQTGPRVTAKYLNSFLPPDVQVPTNYHGHTPLSEAKEKWPDWYKRRIKKKQPRKTFPPRSPGIYFDWKRKIYEGARVGHRYSCLENLCSLGVQCGISAEQVEADCEELAEYLEKLTVDEDNHFTSYDVKCALQTYYGAGEGAYRRTVEYVSARTGIPLTRNRRNGRTKAQHLKLARFARDLNYADPDGPDGWRAGNGRRPKKDVVQRWRAEHPDGRKADCIRDTGLSKPTVYKWWDPHSDSPESGSGDAN